MSSEARTLMTGEYIKDARVRPGEQLQGPYVELILNDQGGRLFEQITAANVKRRMAIVLDNNVYSAPVIQERIGGGRASITGSFDIKEARDLVHRPARRRAAGAGGDRRRTHGRAFVGARLDQIRASPRLSLAAPLVVLVHGRLLQGRRAWSRSWRWSSTSCSWSRSWPASRPC